MSKKKPKRKEPEAVTRSHPDQMEATYYKERKEVKQALRVYAASQGHGSVGRAIREATKAFIVGLQLKNAS